MQGTRDIAALEATIASLESQIESLSRDNDALAAENRRLAEDAARADSEWAARMESALAKQAAEKDRAYAQLRSEHDKLVELVKMANAREFGAKSERVLPHQISLFNDLEACAPAPPPEPAPGPKAEKGRKPKKKVDWASFGTVVVEHEIPEGERSCPACGRGMEPMGYEVRREFVYVPAGPRRGARAPRRQVRLP